MQLCKCQHHTTVLYPGRRRGRRRGLCGRRRAGVSAAQRAATAVRSCDSDLVEPSCSHSMAHN